MPEQATKIKTICIVAIVFAGLGLLTTFTGIAGLVLPRPKFSHRYAYNQKNDIAKAKVEMQVAMNDLSSRYRPYQVSLLIVRGILSATMLISGIMTFRNSEAGPKLLFSVFLLAIPFDLVGGYFGVVIASETSAIMTRYMQQITQATNAGRPDAGIGSLATGIMNMGMNFGMGFSVTWILCKVGFYVYGVVALKNPSTQKATPPPLPAQ